MNGVAFRKVSAFRIDDDLLEGLQLVWERDHITVSEQVRVAIRVAGVERRPTAKGGPQAGGRPQAVLNQTGKFMLRRVPS